MIAAIPTHETPHPPASGVIVRGTGYVPMVHPRKPQETGQERHRRIEAALRYATAYLVQAPPDGAVDTTRELFRQGHRHVTLDAARAALRTRYGERAAFHRLVLSPDASLGVGASADDLIDWTRLVLARAQERAGARWLWVGGVHSNTRTRHAHVIVAGRSMEGGDVTMTRGLFARMREDGWRAAGEIARRRDRRYERFHGLGV